MKEIVDKGMIRDEKEKVMNRNKEQMVFDWDKAAELIRQSGAQKAAAGLRSDWEDTGVLIFEDGKPVPQEDTCVFLASTWAVPELALETPEDDQFHECYKMQSETPGWNSDTYWPKSALLILEGKALPSGDNVSPAENEDGPVG